MQNSKVKEHNKLVRDNIPALVQKEGNTCEYKRIVKPQTRAKLLVQKLNEEGSELYKEMLFEPRGKVIEELADVYEVFLALCKLNEVQVNDVIVAADLKRLNRGSFDRGIFLKSVTEHDPQELYDHAE